MNAPAYTPDAPRFPEITVQLSGTDGNVFALAGKVTGALKREGHRDEASELMTELWQQPSYDAALALFMTYVDVA